MSLNNQIQNEYESDKKKVHSDSSILVLIVVAVIFFCFLLPNLTTNAQPEGQIGSGVTSTK